MWPRTGAWYARCLKFLESPAATGTVPGPCRIPTPELPVRPGPVGIDVIPSAGSFRDFFAAFLDIICKHHYFMAGPMRFNRDGFLLSTETFSPVALAGKYYDLVLNKKLSGCVKITKNQQI